MSNTLLSDSKLIMLRILSGLTNHLPGVAIEVGVCQGGSLLQIAKSMPHRTVYGFDTFQGLPPKDWIEGEGHRPGDFESHQRKVQTFVGARAQNAFVVAGYFPDVANKTFKHSQEICFAHLDVDFGQGTRNALEWLHKHLIAGAIVVLDDWDWPACPNIRPQVEAFTEVYQGYYNLIPTVQYQAALLRIK